jgi:hypothetical protein
MHFIRFVVGEIHEDSARELGVFQAAFRLRNDGRLLEYEEAVLRETLDWFNEHLEKPSRLTTSKPPHYRKQARAISWFKSSAKEHISRVREIIAILDSHNVSTRMVKTVRPGYVVYEDEFQIAAEPFKDVKI